MYIYICVKWNQFAVHYKSTILFFFFWLYGLWGSLGTPPGIKSWVTAVKAWSPNHWAARELPFQVYFNKK